MTKEEMKEWTLDLLARDLAADKLPKAHGQMASYLCAIDDSEPKEAVEKALRDRETYYRNNPPQTP